MLRSDYAPNKVKTSVELEFSHKNEIYTVTRVPSYVRPNTKTPVAAEASFVNESGSLNIAKSRDVTNKIEEIIGLDRNQFTQVSMLAQGEFKKLLYAGSSERRDIFRKIFSTHSYDNMQENLKKSAEELKRQCEDTIKAARLKAEEIKGTIKSDVEAEPEEFMKELDALIEKDSIEEKKFTEQLDALRNKIIEKNTMLSSCAEVNKELERLERLRAELDALKKCDGEIKEKKKRLKLSEDCRTYIMPFEQEMNICGVQLEKLEKNTESTEKKLEAALKGLPSVKAKFEQLKNDEEKRTRLAGEINELEKAKPEYKLLDELALRTETILAEIAKDEARLAKYDGDIGAKEAEIERLETEKQGLKETPEQEVALRIECNSLRERKQRIESLLKDIKKLEAVKESAEKAAKEYREAEVAWEKKNNEALRLERQFYLEQAGIMAMSLEDGCACPVCGSTEHPRKAELSEKAPSEAEVNEAKAAAEAAGTVRHSASVKSGQALARYEAEKKAVEERASELGIADSGKAEESKAAADKELNGKEAEHKRLESDCKRLNVIIGSIEKLTGEEKRLKEERMALEGELAEKKSGLAAAKSAYNEKKSRLSYDDYDSALRRQKEARRELDENKAALEAAENRFRGLEAEVRSYSAVIEDLKPKVESVKKSTDEAANRFALSCGEYGLSGVEEYRLACLKVSENEKLKSEINTYTKKLAADTAVVNELAEKHKNHTYTKLDDIEKNLAELKEEEKNEDEYLTYLKNAVKINSDARKRIKELLDSGSELLKKHKVIKNLSDTANGSLSSKAKISFEEYVQSSKFEKVLKAANRRLDVMDKKHILRRRTEAKDLKRHSGLEIDIINLATGVARDVKTLSGGESFMASMSLALGVSDIIGAEKRGIDIESVFVDEGFGTLDEESLRKALQLLLDLSGDTRTVGIISHVKELCNEIEKRIIVTSTGSGSKVRQEI